MPAAMLGAWVAAATGTATPDPRTVAGSPTFQVPNAAATADLPF
jgi:hypothetical protein